MPLGPSGCILRASLVGDAHKYVLVYSNVCAVLSTLNSSLFKSLTVLCLTTQMSTVCAHRRFCILGHLCRLRSTIGTNSSRDRNKLRLFFDNSTLESVSVRNCKQNTKHCEGSY